MKTKLLMMMRTTMVIVISLNLCLHNTWQVWTTRIVPLTNNRPSLIDRLSPNPLMRWVEGDKYIQRRSSNRSLWDKAISLPFLHQVGNNLISTKQEWLQTSWLSSNGLTLLKKWTWVWEAKDNSRIAKEWIVYHSLAISIMSNRDNNNNSLLLNKNSYSK